MYHIVIFEKEPDLENFKDLKNEKYDIFLFVKSKGNIFLYIKEKEKIGILNFIISRFEVSFKETKNGLSCYHTKKSIYELINAFKIFNRLYPY